MKIKILLAGNNASRHQFLQSLGKQVSFKQAGASVNIVGTGTYTFRLGDDDIEVMYIEDCKELQKNYKKYAVDAKAIIFVDADEETERLLTAACPKHTPVAKNTPGKVIDGMAGIKVAVAKVHARQTRLAGNPQTVFQSPVAKKTESVAASKVQTTGQGVNLELLKQFLDKTPKRVYK